MSMKKTVQFKVGEVYLMPHGDGRYERVEVADIQGELLYLEFRYSVNGWMKAEEFLKKEPVKYGEFQERGFWPFKRRELIRA
jgi:hypothetical protein